MSQSLGSLLGAGMFGLMSLYVLRQRGAWQRRAIAFQEKYPERGWHGFFPFLDARGSWYQTYLLTGAGIFGLLSLLCFALFIVNLLDGR